MGWATFAIEALRQGQTVKITPHGHSMRGKVNDGDTVTLAPVDPASVAVGDGVLVRVKGNILLHLVKAINGDRFLIGNNRGDTNGWVGRHCLYGIATKVEPR